MRQVLAEEARCAVACKTAPVHARTEKVHWVTVCTELSWVHATVQLWAPMSLQPMPPRPHSFRALEELHWQAEIDAGMPPCHGL